MGRRSSWGRSSFRSEHGFYDAPFQLQMQHRTPGVSIYYTLDGTEPSADNPTARLYSNPLNISRTTVVRAKAFLTDVEPSRTATTSYLFTDDIVRQSPNGETPAGFPKQLGIQRQGLRDGSGRLSTVRFGDRDWKTH